MTKGERTALLLEEQGELITGLTLRKSLGFSSARAFRRAAKAGTCPVPVFKLPARKGWFARTEAVRSWLAGLP